MTKILRMMTGRDKTDETLIARLREEARAFCAELVADDGVVYDDMVDEGVIDADSELSYDERAAA